MSDFPRGNQVPQDLFMRDIAPGCTLFQGGVGSGKTFGGARKFCYLHALNECPSLVSAPTYGDLWRFVVPAITSVLEEWHWPYRVIRSLVPRLEVAGQPVYLISGEHPERFAGFEVGIAWVDEGARMQSSLLDPLRDAPMQIRTRIRHPHAKILHLMVTTTPEGMDTWVQRDWFDKPLPAHRAYIGSTLANAALPPSYIESLKASLPAELIEQYLGGKAVSYITNRAHPTFTRVRHVRETAYRPGLPVHIGADYNVSPMGWVIAQVVGEDVNVLDEVYLADFAQVDMAMHASHEKLLALSVGGNLPFVVFHPDKNAKNRKTTGDPEFLVMESCARKFGWSFTGDAFGANPSVDARINLVSRMLLDATGRSRMAIHPRCAHLIDDLERTARASNGYDPGSEGKHGHILDALGYLIWDVAQPMGKATTSNLL